MRKLLLIIVFTLGTHAYLYGQVVSRGPVTTANKVGWTNPAGVSLTDSSTFEYRMRDGNFIPVTALTGVQCVLSGSQINCTAALTQSNVDALNMVGIHAITLALFRADVGEGVVSTPFTLTSPAGAPTTVRLIP